MSTISCFRKLGIDIDFDGENVTVHGKGLHGLTAPTETLDVGNSGTTIRLISGILSAQNFDTKLNGDASIQKRPMRRVINPLTEMGANIEAQMMDLLLSLYMVQNFILLNILCLWQVPK